MMVKLLQEVHRQCTMFSGRSCIFMVRLALMAWIDYIHIIYLNPTGVAAPHLTVCEL